MEMYPILNAPRVLERRLWTDSQKIVWRDKIKTLGIGGTVRVIGVYKSTIIARRLGKARVGTLRDFGPSTVFVNFPGTCYSKEKTLGCELYYYELEPTTQNPLLDHLRTVIG